MGSFLKKNASVHIKRTWLLVIAGLAYPLGFFPPFLRLLVGYFEVSSLSIVLPLIPWFLPLGLLVLWNRWWVERRGCCRADESGLWLDDRLLVPREKIKQGYVFEQGERTMVRLGRGLRFLQVEVDDEEEGLGLLAAMRLDPGRSVAQYTANQGSWRGSWLRASLLLGGVLAMSFLVPVLRLPLATLVLPVVLSVLFAINSYIRVAIGADGVRLRRLLGRSRFVSFASIRSVESDGRDIRILLRDGEAICFHFPGGGKAERAPAMGRGEAAMCSVWRGW